MSSEQEREQADHRGGHLVGRGSRRARASGASSSFKVGRREIGHLHGDHAAHFVFPKRGLGASSSGRGGSRRTRSSPAREGPASRAIRSRGRRARGDRAAAPELRPIAARPPGRRSGGVSAVDDREPVAIVTGASRGLGLALTSALSSAGGGSSSMPATAAALERAAGAPSRRRRALAGDVADAAHRARARRGGRRADRPARQQRGHARPEPAAGPRGLPARRARGASSRSNVVAPLALVQLALPRLAAGAAIVNVTSDAARRAVRRAGAATARPRRRSTS